MVEKIINFISIAIAPQMKFAIADINSVNPNLGVTLGSIFTSPCDIKDACGANDPDLEKKSAFMSILMNALYALLISIILRRLLKEVKKLIKNALAKQASDRAKRKIKKRSDLLSLKAGKIANGEEKAQEAKIGLAALKSIFNFENNI